MVLIVLGGLLIYSLLLSNVEEKTYEYGMLRALGMKQYVLIELLIIQVIIHSIHISLFPSLFLEFSLACYSLSLFTFPLAFSFRIIHYLLWISQWTQQQSQWQFF